MKWSEEKDPNEEIRYNHVLCETPLGLASIEWKGWKDYDSRGAYLDGDFIASCYTVDEAKEKIKQHIENKIKELIEFIGAKP